MLIFLEQQLSIIFLACLVNISVQKYIRLEIIFLWNKVNIGSLEVFWRNNINKLVEKNRMTRQAGMGHAFNGAFQGRFKSKVDFVTHKFRAMRLHNRLKQVPNHFSVRFPCNNQPLFSLHRPQYLYKLRCYALQNLYPVRIDRWAHEGKARFVPNEKERECLASHLQEARSGSTQTLSGKQ